MKTYCQRCGHEIPPGEVCGCDGLEAQLNAILAKGDKELQADWQMIRDYQEKTKDANFGTY